MVFWILLFRISKILGIVSLIIGLGLGGWIFQQVLSGETKNWQIRDNAIVQRLTSALDIKANKDRLLMWDSGVQGIQDHLVWGIGYGNDKNVMDQYRIPLAEKTIIVLTTVPVQEFTTFTCKHGSIMGSLVFLPT